MSWRRHARWLLAAAPLAALTLTACSGSGARLGLPVAATAEAPNVGNLWLGAWIATLIDPFAANVLFAIFLVFIAGQMALRAIRERRS